MTSLRDAEAVRAYLERIRAEAPREATLDALGRLHRCHMVEVPFENLDIPLGSPIQLSLPVLYDKIVRRRRGGFCYELNGLFAWLLDQLGFGVSLLSARVVAGGRRGPDFDHMVLLVDLGRRWIADVGFGDSFIEPLPLDAGGEAAQQGDATYDVQSSGEEFTLRRREGDGPWEPQYTFTLEPRRLDEFADTCRYHQTSPESMFTRKTICSRATGQGRFTLTNNRLITTEGGRREEREVRTHDEYVDLLRSLFGVSLGNRADVERLMTPQHRSG